MNKTKVWWLVTFLAVFPILWLPLELWASFDRSDNTVPLTFVIVDLPAGVFYPLAIIFCTWFPIHLLQYRHWRHPEDPVAAAVFNALRAVLMVVRRGLQPKQ